jgi:predicted DNA repair protein MutK
VYCVIKKTCLAGLFLFESVMVQVLLACFYPALVKPILRVGRRFGCFLQLVLLQFSANGKDGFAY